MGGGGSSPPRSGKKKINDRRPAKQSNKLELPSFIAKNENKSIKNACSSYVILGTVAASTSGWAASARIPTSAGRGSGTQGQAVQVVFFKKNMPALVFFIKFLFRAFFFAAATCGRLYFVRGELLEITYLATSRTGRLGKSLLFVCTRAKDEKKLVCIGRDTLAECPHFRLVHITRLQISGACYTAYHSSPKYFSPGPTPYPVRASKRVNLAAVGPGRGNWGKNRK